MDKDANQSVTTVTDLDTWQRIAGNQRKRRNHKDVSNVTKYHKRSLTCFVMNWI